MGKKEIGIFCLFLLAINVAYTQGIVAGLNKIEPLNTGSEMPDISLGLIKEKSQLWVHSLYKEWSIQDFDQDLPEIFPEIVNIPDFNQISYRIQNEGVIKFKNGEKIFLKLHSSHDDSEIGDIVVAFTKKGEIYTNQGHVCGGIIHFVRHWDAVPVSKDEFFDNFYSDTDDTKWLKSDSSQFTIKAP